MARLLKYVNVDSWATVRRSGRSEAIASTAQPRLDDGNNTNFEWVLFIFVDIRSDSCQLESS